MELKFLGSGGAFDSTTNSCAYLRKGDEVLFIDMGENAFENVKKVLSETTKRDSINVAITHTHSDHIGALGTFVFYCYYILGVTTTIHCDKKLEPALQSILDIFGLVDHQYNLKNGSLDNFTLEFYETEHVEELDCFGILIQELENNNYVKEQIYYSGDSCSIPGNIERLLIEGQINKFYQDITLADYPGNVHYNIDKFINDFPAAATETKVYFYHNTVFNPETEFKINLAKNRRSIVKKFEHGPTGLSDMLKFVFDNIELPFFKIHSFCEDDNEAGNLCIRFSNKPKEILRVGQTIMFTSSGNIIIF